MMERLQKALARAGVASRRAAERLIDEGRVTVNGSIVRTQGVRVDPARDAIKVDGKRVPAPAKGRTYLMLNKPRGYVTTLSDPQGRPTIADLVRDARSVHTRVVPVGRLDFNSEGLLILTDDGDLAFDLMHPASGVPKTYAVKVRGEPNPATLRRLRAGITLDGKPARPTHVRIARKGANARLEVTVVEGRKHLVRRLLAAVGHPVSRLKRVRYGPLDLGQLAAGEVRPLIGPEIVKLRRAVGRKGPRQERTRPV
jgi:23S rRNA pseudouridine2605 synthase